MPRRKEGNATIAKKIYQDWYPNELLTATKKTPPWFEGKDAIVQEDGATPYTGKNTLATLKKAGRAGGWGGVDLLT